MRSEPAAHDWLLLIHQLPAKPAYLRVKTWRRLQSLGAVGLKGSVYALPDTEAALADLQRLLDEIIDGGGEGFITRAQLVDGLDDAGVEGMFQRARSEDYRLLKTTLDGIGAPAADAEPALAETEVSRVRRRFEQIAAIDFFAAPGREAVEQRLAKMEAQLAGTRLEESAPAAPPEPLVGRVWVTRLGVQVDRIACAWLIRRFIDPTPRFRFVPPKGFRPEPGVLRFDMTDAEFGREADRCSFETLLARRQIRDPALIAIGEIIHDLDLKDGRFGRPETAGIGRMLEATAAAHQSDEARIMRGSAMLDDLYTLFSAGG